MPLPSSLTLIPLVGLALCVAVLAAIAFAPYLRAFRRAWFVIACAIATVYGGSKWRFNFSNGVTDAGSYATNNLACAVWTYNPAYGLYTFRWAFRDLTLTNEVGVCIDTWHYLPDALVSDGMAYATVLDATNMEYTCYAQYIPPPAVVTNGVYHLEGISRSMATTNSPMPDYVPWGTRVEIVLPNGDIKVITPTNAPPEYSNQNLTQENQNE